MRRVLASLTVLALVSCATPSTGPPPLSADVHGAVQIPTDDGLVLGGDLTLPEGTKRVGAIVLMHGCSGLPTRSVTVWQPLLLSWGYATLVVDSFTARGLRAVCNNALRLTGAERIPDAYGALAFLARHPRIDPGQVMLMGFSHGGIATLGSATTWARRRYAPLAGPIFRGFLPFSPYCNAIVPEMLEGLAGPVRVHIGELDDWTPARSCQDLGALARSMGYDMEVTVYPGAQHGFDAVGLPPALYQRNADNAADCTPRLASMMGPILNLFELMSCIKKGATVGHSPEATERARANVHRELEALRS